jgi:hypothetical protein
VPTPVREEAQPAAKRAVAAPGPAQIEKSGVTPRAPAPLSPTGRVNEGEKAKAIPSRAEPKPVTPPPAAIKEPTAPKAAKSEKQAPGKPVPPDREKANGGEKKAGEHQTPAEKPAAPPTSP